MSDDKTQQEPSMEDILASIRRILSEDDAAEASKTLHAPGEGGDAQPADPPPPPPPPERPKMVEPPPPEPEEEDVLELTDEMVAEEEPEAMEFEDEDIDIEPEPPHPLRPALNLMAEPDRNDEESLLAPPVAAVSTTAIAELARAVARERGIGLGNGGITLESLVRELLKPMIKEWLDANLPSVIDRIVRQEIEKMINRAEKL